MYIFSIILFLIPIVVPALFVAAFFLWGRSGRDVAARRRAVKAREDAATPEEAATPEAYPYAVRPIGKAKPAPSREPYPYAVRPINPRQAA